MEDYTLDRFFRVQGEVKLPDGSTIYLRSLSDSEMGMRRKAAMLAALKRRQELQDENGAAFRNFIAPLSDADDEDLTQTIINLSVREFTREAIENYPQRHIPYPDDAELKERLDVDEKRDAHRRDVLKKREKYILQRSTNLEKTVRDKWTREQRIAKCVQLQKENQATAAFVEEDGCHLIFLGCFKDRKRKKSYFASPAQADELDTRVKAKLYQELITLNKVDVFAVQDFSSTES